ncbi:heme biosynthesis HemY N-terminal domain-containing protein [Saccharospirillum impatiens]|uniref:heme biosynthesis HemY N-terminal domain-containing protein n=1 Tax=Saccharospirillum impatiens TaxID=169438 RepID=UPI0004256D78|nr:heme biosynthesis HemY N-terminal domain-containing protein [Saccharospirillum impatiens]
MSRLLLKVLLWLVLVLAAGLLAHFMVRYPGYVMIAWGQWMVEITLWSAVGLFLVLLLVSWLAIKLLRGVNPVRLARQYRDRRDRKTARVATGQAVMAWLEGDDSAALSALHRVVKAGGSERLPRVLTLIPAQDSGDWPALVSEFKRTDPDLALVADVLTAERLVQSGDSAALLALWQQEPGLQRIRKLQPDYWRALMDQGQAGVALHAINKTPNLNPFDRVRWQQQVALQLIEQGCQTSVDALLPLKTLPKLIRQKADVVAAECRCLLMHGQVDNALKRLTKALEKAPAPVLLRCLLDEHLPGTRTLPLAEHLEKRHGPNPELMLTLGQLCEAQSLWGKAEDYLVEAWRTDPNRETGLALANFFEHRQQTDRALAQYRELAHLGD